MKLATYVQVSEARVGAVVGDSIVDLQAAASAQGRRLPSGMLPLLEAGAAAMDTARDVVERADLVAPYCVSLDRVLLLAPIPRPPSVRDGYAFRRHVETSRRNRGLPMIDEFDRFPVFYFTNHHAVVGPGAVHVREAHLDRLDFELECAAVIGRGGRNIPSSRADQHIAGFMIMNDLSARALQMQEMKLNLGPAKGKDFATAFGPWLVTPDELGDRCIEGPRGARHDLLMTAKVNGLQVSRDTLRSMSWTFAEIIERASYGVDLVSGDVIGSGTCGTGCFLELNGSKITNDMWLRDGDRVELTIERLGTLVTDIVLAEEDAHG